ncbi:MAG: hypothetical protein AABZ39_01975 [Spirochaetota bacterium]
MAHASFKNMVKRFAGVQGLDVALTLKSGNVIHLGDYSVQGDRILGSRSTARMNDVTFMEVESIE